MKSACFRAKIALPLIVAASLGLGCATDIQTCTGFIAPTQAWASSSSSRLSSAPDSPDHLGTLHFGGLTVEIPSSFSCKDYDVTTSDKGLSTTRIDYSSHDMALFLSFEELSGSLWEIFPEPDDMASLFDAPYSDYESLDDECRMSYLGDGLFQGLYIVNIEEDLDACVVVTVAMDEAGNVLILKGIPCTEDDVDECWEIVDSISGAYAPESSSGTSNAPGSSARSSRPSHTPTRGEQNALDQARSYLDIMAFSRTGLIEQLEYKGYTSSEAEYAAENCGADWYEQAVLKAESYLNVSHFSRAGLIDTLEYAGFTTSEAEYAVGQCDVDWYEQAVLKAKDYLEIKSFSRSGLIEMLEYVGFTYSQASAAATAVGL